MRVTFVNLAVNCRIEITFLERIRYLQFWVLYRVARPILKVENSGSWRCEW